MDKRDQQIAELQEQLRKISTELGQLQSVVYKNNFSASQVFSKDVEFSSSLKVPSYSSPPSVAQVGHLIEISGVLYICTTAGDVSSPATFTVVGTQV